MDNEAQKHKIIIIASIVVIVLAVAAAVIFVIIPGSGGKANAGAVKNEIETEGISDNEDSAEYAQDNPEIAESSDEDKTIKEPEAVEMDYEMPNLSGMKISEAIKEIEGIGLKYVTEYEKSADVPDGCIIRQSIDAGEAVNKSNKIILYVSQREKNQDETIKEDILQTEVSYPTPVFTRAKASSEAHYEDDSNNNDYDAYNALDGDRKTAWNEGGAGTGAGEWITFYADTPQHVRGVRIKAGYAKSEKIYYNNSRPKKITLYLDDGNQKSKTLQDLYNEYQTIEFQQEHDISEITIYIDSVYEGIKFEDCCITEVEFY